MYSQLITIERVLVTTAGSLQITERQMGFGKIVTAFDGLLETSFCAGQIAGQPGSAAFSQQARSNRAIRIRIHRSHVARFFQGSHLLRGFLSLAAQSHLQGERRRRFTE